MNLGFSVSSLLVFFPSMHLQHLHGHTRRGTETTFSFITTSQYFLSAFSDKLSMLSMVDLRAARIFSLSVLIRYKCSFNKTEPTNSNLSPQSKDFKNESAHTSSALTRDKCGSKAWLCWQGAGLAHRWPCTNPDVRSALQLWRAEVVRGHYQQHGKSEANLRPSLSKINK